MDNSSTLSLTDSDFRKYPTKANIEHLKAEAAEKRQRYEVIREKKSVTEVKPSKNEPKRTGKRKNRRKQFTLPVSTKTAEPELYKGVPPFAGTCKCMEYA